MCYWLVVDEEVLVFSLFDVRLERCSRCCVALVPVQPTDRTSNFVVQVPICCTRLAIRPARMCA